MTNYVDIASEAEVDEGSNKAFKVANYSVLICRTGGEIFAVENVCSHLLQPLEGGAMRRCFIFCPAHGARFDLRDGSTAGKLTKKPIKTFGVRLVEGRILVQVSDSTV